jgi:hypothetical protein
MFCYCFIRQRCGWIRTETSKFGIPDDRGGNIKVAVTVCTVPILVCGVCAEACQWYIKQWVTVAAVGIFASVASVRVLPVRRTRRHYISVSNGRSRAGEGRCSQTLIFRYEIGGASATVSISCALGVTGTDVETPGVFCVFSSYFALWPANRSSLGMRGLKILCELWDNDRL